MGEGLHPRPIAWPSILREWFWRIKTAGLASPAVSIKMAAVPDFWAKPCPPTEDRRYRILNKFLMPSVSALSVTNRHLSGSVRNENSNKWSCDLKFLGTQGVSLLDLNSDDRHDP